MNTNLIIYLTITGVFSIILFLFGFFPMKKYDGSIATLDSLPEYIEDIRVDKNELYKPVIGRLVIMVIDALRLDFVKGSEGHLNMPYITSLINGKKGCLLTGRATPPTVTMPRIKAMTTGTVPNFVDIALNLGSSKILEDNILFQARNRGMKLIFYGDETWLKLFPNTFTRSEGTTSFFVSDFTEVDDNVTRHLVTELGAEDWRIMVLHYLGLDHIGHVEGPQSPLVRPKLQQMDRIVKKIHRRFLVWEKHTGSPSLLVVCGDHGMKNSGSHGGASLEEVLVPIIAIGNICTGELTSGLFGEAFESSLPQIDLVPTLSMLLGLPIPTANLGKMIPELLHNVPVSRQLYALYYNCKQVASQFRNNIAHAASQASYLEYKKAVELHSEWLTLANKANRSGLDERIARLYMSALTGMSSKLADSMITFDVPLLYVTSIMLWQVVLLLFMEIRSQLVHVTSVVFITITLLSSSIVWCSYSQDRSLLCSYSLVTSSVRFLVITMVAINVCIIVSSKFKSIKHSQMMSMEQGEAILVMGTLLHAFSFLSSSFVEEEHQVWYFLWLTYAFIILYQLCKMIFINGIYNPMRQRYMFSEQYKSEYLVWYWLILPVLHRLLRKWNQTGDKWASLPDVGDWLVQQEHRPCLSAVLFIGLMTLCFCCYIISARHPGTYRKLVEAVLFIAAAVCIYCYRSAIGNVDMPLSYPHSRGVREVRIFWSILTLLLTKGLGEMLYEVKVQHHNSLRVLSCLLNTVTCCWMLLCALLHRPHNVVLLGVHVFMSECINIIYRHKSVWWLAIAHIWIGNVIYFYQGNSNSLASIDVASGYVGQADYNPIIVGALLITNTYSAPVLSYLLLISNIVFQNQGVTHDRFRYILQNLYNCIAVMRLLPVGVYSVLMIFLRYHLFVWTVFSPKLLYEAVHTIIISLLLVLTEFISRIVVKEIR